MFLPYVIHAFWQKHAFNAWVEKPAFYHPFKSLMLVYYNPCIKIVFSQNVRLMHVLVNVCFTKRPFYARYLTYVKRALMNVRKTCVTRLTRLRAWNVRLPCVLKDACFTHVAHFPVYIIQVYTVFYYVRETSTHSSCKWPNEWHTESFPAIPASESKGKKPECRYCRQLLKTCIFGGLAFVLILRPFFPEVVMSTDLLSFEHPSVLLWNTNS